MDERLLDYERTNRIIESRLTKIETMLDELKHSLMGNGQPGVLAAMETRIKGLEEFRWKAVGGLGAAVFCYEVISKLLKG